MTSANIRPRDAQRLIVLSCSVTKKPVAWEEALHLYDGPMFRTLRNWVEHLPLARSALRSGNLGILILSAEHGFIGPWARIEPYDREMTSARAASFAGHSRNLDAHAAAGGADEIIVVAGGAYRGVIASAHPRLSAAVAAIPPDEGIGRQRARLGRWLRNRYASGAEG